MNLIINQCRQGDPLAWEALVRHYQSRVFAVCLYYLKNREDAADAAQDAFIKVYAGMRRFRGDEPALLPWMLSVTRNCCLDRLRKSGTRERYESEFRAESAAATEEGRAGGDPESIVKRRQERALLYRALEKISGLNRDIVLLKDIQGLKDADVAAILSLPVGTIKSRSHRARIRLGKLLAQLRN